jgi:hypothetical protein
MRASARVASARAFVPPIVPNPRQGDDDANADAAPTLPNIERALAPHGWAIGAERGYDDTPHAFKIFKVRDGHHTLEQLQEALYVSDERGCRIRRETQSLFYMCCDGVRCRLNEGKKEIVVEMPCDLDSVGAYVAKAKVIEDIIKSSQKKRAS